MKRVSKCQQVPILGFEPEYVWFQTCPRNLVFHFLVMSWKDKRGKRDQFENKQWREKPFTKSLKALGEHHDRTKLCRRGQKGGHGEEEAWVRRSQQEGHQQHTSVCHRKHSWQTLPLFLSKLLLPENFIFLTNISASHWQTFYHTVKGHLKYTLCVQTTRESTDYLLGDLANW